MSNVGMALEPVYDHPHFTVVRQAIIEGAAPGASGVDFCQFSCRTKAVVKYVHIRCISAPSVASGAIEITHNGSNNKVHTVSTLSIVAGASWGYTMVSSNTLVTITDTIAIQLAGTEKGVFSVIYEYEVLPA